MSLMLCRRCASIRQIGMGIQTLVSRLFKVAYIGPMNGKHK